MPNLLSVLSYPQPEKRALLFGTKVDVVMLFVESPEFCSLKVLLVSLFPFLSDKKNPRYLCCLSSLLLRCGLLNSLLTNHAWVILLRQCLNTNTLAILVVPPLRIFQMSRDYFPSC